jgi:capsule polysaccharide export protein KpsE/RkpR
MQTTSKKPATVILETTIPSETFQSGWREPRAKKDRVKVLRLLWSRREWVGRVLLIGFVVSLLAAILIPAEYTSNSRLMPPDTQSTGGLAIMAALSGQGGGSLGAMAGDLLGMKTTGALFVAVLRSRTAEDRIVNQFDLKNVYRTRWQDIARKKLETNTMIMEDRKSGVITLSVTDHDPNRAANIARAYVDQLDGLMAQLNTSSAHRERVFLEERLTSIKGDLEAAEKDFSQFASKNGAIDITAQGRAMLESAAGLQGQLIAAESELEGLRQIYADSNVRVRSTQARIAELKSQLAKLGGKYDPAGAATAPATSGAAAANASGGGTSGSASNGSDYPTLRQLPILGVPYADKYRQLKVEEAVFETLTKQFELAKVQEAKEIPSVKVLDSPEVPERKSFPPRTLIVLFGTALALAIAVAWILGEQRWQQIDPGAPGMVFANEVYGTVLARMPWKRADGDSSNGHRSDLPNKEGIGKGTTEG